MKTAVRNSFLALTALLSATVMGGLGGLSAKVALRSVMLMGVFLVSTLPVLNDMMSKRP